ncbi:NAD-dependent epimerase/dehydratase family protein [archaeon]|jgi:nucleoside-diphosphate-sugar epimerase|nr:NAD-dependent epimerase/dehydratase family protein [archaeon]MBT3730792.1 NAD-dependent epimerase/dehydratase family protein [archaeon]MBT4670106.1 NAD-dependent epimerase/dehydratase family protein [archaeon]MBT5030593.1 NAD-dependent epimerase/dehydratase family protein [archaeon]MBT5287946.1 NAD-dependent epimerase/dehydratase family protein [archaeon]
MEKSKILITGASGCVGANLTKKLVEEGNDVRIFILKGTWHPFLDGLKLEVITGDITNIKDVYKAMEGCDYVYQIAGIVSYNKLDEDLIYKVNYLGTKNILEVAKTLKVKKVVVTASTAGIGIPKNKLPLNEDSQFDYKKYKKVMYMYSKHLVIKECEKYAKQNLNVSIVSPTTIYGQGDLCMHIGNVVKKIKEGKLKLIPPGGNSVLSVDDVIDAHILVMKKGRSGENYIFANESITYKEMFSTIAKSLNVKKPKLITPNWILEPTKLSLSLMEYALLPLNKKPLLSPHSINFTFKYRYFDSNKARMELGWKPKQTFEESINKAIKFYTDYKLI